MLWNNYLKSQKKKEYSIYTIISLLIAGIACKLLPELLFQIDFGVTFSQLKLSLFFKF
jgi:hypothetical protein